MRLNKQLLLFFSSFLIVGFAQPDWSPLLCVLAASFGYALFWRALLGFKSKKMRFCSASLWFGAVSILHLNWLLADRYVGAYIYGFLLFLFLCLGMQFGVISLFISESLGMVRILALCGGWTLMEWGRLYFLSGYSWDPVGLSLSSTLIGMQMASLVGIYGLSFWVFLTNLLALRLISNFSWKSASPWVIILCIPYLFGSLHIMLHSRWMKQELRPPLSALLVQTSLLPDEKLPVKGSKPLPPYDQWNRILDLLALYRETAHDLIVLPEGAVPYGTDLPLYHREVVFQVLKKFIPKMDCLPAAGGSRLGNRYWAQALANTYNADVVIGLEDMDIDQKNGSVKAYNAAFLFNPNGQKAERYEKQVLLPMGEYIPFDWCKKILSEYGIMDSFTPGAGAKVFQLRDAHAGISICYEETFGNLMRANRCQGADMLINISNDVWFPLSRLPIVHFMHGRLRAVEEGVPCLRACNTGLTCGIDALGRIVGELPYETQNCLSQPGVLSLTLPLYHYKTFYTLFGDELVIALSVFFTLLLFIKQFILKYLNISPLRKN